jgi:hypothetical protein
LLVVPAPVLRFRNPGSFAQVISWKPSQTNWAQIRFSPSITVGNSEPMFSSIFQALAVSKPWVLHQAWAAGSPQSSFEVRQKLSR